jgi:transposase
MKKPSSTKSQRRSKARRQRETSRAQDRPIEHPHAAGIDIAVNDDLWVDVGEEASASPVRHFSPRTAGVRELCAWLHECQVETVAMEATGSYWLSLYLALIRAGLEVVVVNPRAVRMLKRKSDVSDCQWLRYLHSVGLLRGSFVPAEAFLSLRALSRQRENLLRTAAEHTQRLQKALDEMNLHLHHVIDDVMGTTGRAIIEAILRGERDPQQLAALRDRRIKASAATVAESLEGQWREELVLIVRQEYESWQHLQRQVATCDERLLAQSRQLTARLSEEALDAQTAPQGKTEAARPRRRRRTKTSKNQPADAPQWLRLLHRLLGVDLTLTPGVSLLTVLALVCELGTDWSAFPTAGHFASWLGLCPEHRISGGKVLSRATRTVQHRVRALLKMCAQSLAASDSHLGDLYRRQRARLGAAKANTALARKLACLLWHQVQTQTAYDESRAALFDRVRRLRAQAKLSKAAAELGYQLIPLQKAA